jgi:hypothetical protein
MRLLIIAAFIVVSGCVGVEPLSVIGDQCDKNSDCDGLLVCGLGRCRRECEATRDCALGLRCIKLEELGVCQLPEEAHCERNSDCNEPLVCFMPGGCLVECATDEDCPAGSSCRTDAEDYCPVDETCQVGECVEPEVSRCVYDSTCDYPMVCNELQSCVIECTNDRQCALGLACVEYAGCDGPCMCRIPCMPGADECPAGTLCEPCADGLDCGDGYCERPDPES